MTELVFNRILDADYGQVTVLSPLVRRVIAHNPSPFTFHGTGTYIVGHGQVAVIDPGPDLPAHVEAIQHALLGEQVSHILITHTHADHSPAAAALRAVTGAATYAFGPHPSGEEGVEAGADTSFQPDHLLKEGDALSGPGWTIDVLHTPGHISNHLCFALREEHALFSGDHVMGWSTTVIVPPDGHMGDYLRNLTRLLDRDDAIYYPTHGAPIEQPREFVRGLIGHRRRREADIFACVQEGIGSIDDIVARLYRDVPRHLHAAAAQSVRAHLIHLMEAGQVSLDDTAPGEPRYRSTTAS
jgi:glyoxylase-like metal-dependent hydrolase (beta-lactamase superfamily II)